MAHEKIIGRDPRQHITVQWLDDLDYVSIGLTWEGEVAQSPTGDDPTPQTPDEVAPGVPGPDAPLQPYQNAQGQWSMFIELDRPRIQALIKAARRGRNRAFGPDE